MEKKISRTPVYFEETQQTVEFTNEHLYDDGYLYDDEYEYDYDYKYVYTYNYKYKYRYHYHYK